MEPIARTAVNGSLLLIPGADFAETPGLLTAQTPSPTQVLQNIIHQVNTNLVNDPSLINNVLSQAEIAAAQSSSAIARMQYGNALERLVARRIATSDVYSSMFQYVGGPGNPDFVGLGSAAGMNFDLTTTRRSPHIWLDQIMASA